MSENEQPIRVVLADDHAAVRQGVRQFLETSDRIEVIAEAADGVEALHLIQERQPDVAVLDIQMPGHSGIEVTRAVRAARLPTAVLILTAFDDDPYVRAVLEAGANGYVLKTADAAEIIQAVADVHEGRSVLDPAIARLTTLRLPTLTPTGADLDEALTDRETEVLQLLSLGLPNKTIATRLGISEHTAKFHVGSILAKLGAASRTEAVTLAARRGLLVL